MIIKEIIGNTKDLSLNTKEIDLLQLDWFEVAKRVQRRHTQAGREVSIKFLKEGQRLSQDDVLFMSEDYTIVVDILPCDAIIVHPHSLTEMGRVCYEIGNKHLPMFIENGEVLLPFEEPIYRWLLASFYSVRKEHIKLLNMLNANVSHGHGGNSNSSLLSKVIGLVSKE
ncbi:urease accessory protein UreE [Flavobacteriaceae bacterium CRH]|nr:urease accessory protein UreE [Flavobacteriaceae bacterium CRH]